MTHSFNPVSLLFLSCVWPLTSVSSRSASQISSCRFSPFPTSAVCRLQRRKWHHHVSGGADTHAALQRSRTGPSHRSDLLPAGRQRLHLHSRRSQSQNRYLIDQSQPSVRLSKPIWTHFIPSRWISAINSSTYINIHSGMEMKDWQFRRDSEFFFIFYF